MNHFYEETEEKIQGPTVGPVTFFRRIKVIHVQSGINNHYQNSPPHTRRVVLPNAYPVGFRASKILQEAPAEYPNRKRHYDPDLQLRPLEKVVSGTHGEYYESVNGNLRPLGDVVVNQTGQFFELVKNPVTPHDSGRFNERKNKPSMRSNSNGRDNTPDQDETFERRKESQTNNGAYPPQSKPYGLVYEKLFSDTGSYIRVSFGDFEAELTDQIANPDLLKPENLLDCMLQIYRIHRPIPVERLALVEQGDPALAADINFLSEKKALALGVKIQLGKRQPANKQQVQLAVPGQYLFRISLLFDPTLKDENIQFEGSIPQNGHEPVTNGNPDAEESIME